MKARVPCLTGQRGGVRNGDADGERFASMVVSATPCFEVKRSLQMIRRAAGAEGARASN